MKKLEDFILDMKRDTIVVDDVLYSYWPDTESLEKRLIVLNRLIEQNQENRQHLRKREQRVERRKLSDECWPLFVERKKIKAQLKSRHDRVALAFNQLFLQEKVKGEFNIANGIVGKMIWQTYTELRARAISECEEAIEQTRREIEGKEPSITNCWYFNLKDYLKSYKRTEILKRSEMSSLLKQCFKPKGELICVGSELAMSVWPSRIIRN
jgi:hypothetical protein